MTGTLPAPAPPTLWDRRRDLVAAELETIALDLFVARGIDEVTVQDIADAAGISARTFFRYFPTKADVLRAHRRRLFDRLVRALADRPARESPTEALRAAFLATATMPAGDEARVAAIGRLLEDPSVAGRDIGYEAARGDELVALLGRHTRRPGGLALQVEVAATLAACQVAYRAWLTDERRGSFERVMRAAFAALDALG